MFPSRYQRVAAIVEQAGLLIWEGPVPIIKAKIPAPLWRVDSTLLASCCHTVQNLHVLRMQRYYLEIVGDPRFGDRLGQDDTASVDLVGDENGGSASMVLFRDGCQFRIAQQWGVCTEINSEMGYSGQGEQWLRHFIEHPPVDPRGQYASRRIPSLSQNSFRAC